MKNPTDEALVPRDELSRYFSEIGEYPLLTREEERALAVRVQEDGDPDAAQQLVLANLQLVVKIARDYQRVWTNLLALIQEGNVGLVQAVKRFDPQRGVKLSSYSAYWIRAYILKYLIDNIRLVRVGGSRAERKLFFQMNRAKRELEKAGFSPEPKLLAESLDVSEKDVVDMERRLSHKVLVLRRWAILHTLAPGNEESPALRIGALAHPTANRGICQMPIHAIGQVAGGKPRH